MKIYNASLDNFLTWVRFDTRSIVVTSDSDGKDGIDNIRNGKYFELNKSISFGDKSRDEKARKEIPDLLYAWLLRTVVTVHILFDDKEMMINKPGKAEYDKNDKQQFSKLIIVVEGDKHDERALEMLNNKELHT